MRMKCGQKVEIIDQKWNGITSSKFVASFFVFILLSIFNCYSDAWLLCSECLRCAWHTRTFFLMLIHILFRRARSLLLSLSLYAQLFAIFLFDLKWHARRPTCNSFFIPSTLTASFSSCYNYFHKQPMAIRQQHFTKTTINSLNAAILYGGMEDWRYLWAISINLSFVDAFCYKFWWCERARMQFQVSCQNFWQLFTKSTTHTNLEMETYELEKARCVLMISIISFVLPSSCQSLYSIQPESKGTVQC